MLQNVHLFQEQLRMNLNKSERLAPSLGGRYIPTSKESSLSLDVSIWNFSPLTVKSITVGSLA
jgi:hypothetical protein|tara:strand:+ start:239 stop:427 length:189 start_codon:yes stop_codon:yes gene_type:complete